MNEGKKNSAPTGGRLMWVLLIPGITLVVTGARVIATGVIASRNVVTEGPRAQIGGAIFVVLGLTMIAAVLWDRLGRGQDKDR